LDVDDVRHRHANCRIHHDDRLVFHGRKRVSQELLSSGLGLDIRLDSFDFGAGIGACIAWWLGSHPEANSIVEIENMTTWPIKQMHTNHRQQMRIEEFDFSDTGFAAGVDSQRRSVSVFR
jgi:hypothetical protein